MRDALAITGEGSTVKGSRRWPLVAVALVTALALSGLAACDDGVGSDAEVVTGGDAGQTVDSIPPGTATAEGGGGPTQYSFREAWRRALPSAEKWRSGAYLVSAVGNYVNDEGVPGEWRFTFINQAKPDALLWLYVDPWGNITNSREESGDAVASNVGELDKAIHYDVIDSDEAVRIGLNAMGAQYDLEKTRDPRIALGWDPEDGSGPYWWYSRFYTLDADYVAVEIDALTGAVAP